MAKLGKGRDNTIPRACFATLIVIVLLFEAATAGTTQRNNGTQTQRQQQAPSRVEQARPQVGAGQNNARDAASLKQKLKSREGTTQNSMARHGVANAPATHAGGRSYRGLPGSTQRVQELRGMLDKAHTRSGNFGMGVATASEAKKMGQAFVGPGHSVNAKGYLVSSDGLRRYRPPRFKSRQGVTQANFERRADVNQQFEAKHGATNGHLNIDVDG